MAPAEKILDFRKVLNLCRQQMEFALGEHLQADIPILQPSLLSDLVSEHDLQLVGATVSLDRPQNFLVKIINFRHYEV